MKHWKVLLLLPLLSSLSLPVLAADKVSVMLEWFTNPDQAQLVIAKQKGYFADEGLEVSLEEPADPSMGPKLVAAGKVDMAISYQPQLHMQVDEGMPLLRIGTLIATPLNTLLVKKSGPIKTLADLKGKRIGYSVAGIEDTLIAVLLKSAHLQRDDVELVNVNFSLTPALMAGQVDAVIGAYRNFELTQMKIAGEPGRPFYIEEHGIPDYDELILEVNNSTRNDPRWPRFMRALTRATRFIVNHPDEAWKDFVASNPQELDTPLNKQAFKDTVRRFALRPSALDNNRYEDFAEFMRQNNLLKNDPPAVSDYAIQVP